MNNCPNCQKKNQKIEHLERELKASRTTVLLVERDIREAARDHLTGRLPLRLSLRSLIDLMVALARKQAFKEASRTVAETGLELILRKTLQNLHVNIQEAFPIPVLIRPLKDTLVMKYSAVALRGGVKHAKGMTPDEAYERLKDFIASAVATNPQLLASVQVELVPAFDRAKPFKDDKIMGFRVNVRMAESVA